MTRSPHDAENFDHSKRKKTALIIAILLSSFAFVLQIDGSFLTGSLALLGDTAHLMADLFSLSMSLLAVYLAALPTNQFRSFGLYRLEVLAAFINGILLLLVGGGLVWESVERLLHPQPVLALPLIGVAAIGMIINLISALVLMRVVQDPHSHSHEHGHHHDHSHEDRNIHGALLHVLADALGSLLVVVGAIVTYFSDWLWVDPALAILLALVLLRWSIRLLLDSGHVLLEGTPRHLKADKVLQALQACDPRVRAIHDLHIWEITSRMYAATAEVEVAEMSLKEADQVRSCMNQLLRESFGIAHVVLSLGLRKNS